MQKLFRLTLLISVLLFSCKSSNIIPERDMVSILVNVYVTDATVIKSDLRNTFFEKDTIDYYGRIYQKFGYTSAQFDSSYVYYSKNPKKLDAIYDRVIFELSRIQTDLVQLSKKDSTIVDSTKNFWPLKLDYNLNLKSQQDVILFEMPVIDLGTYTLSYNIQIYPDDESIDPQLKVYFYYDNKTLKGEFSQYATVPYLKNGIKKIIVSKMELKNSLVTHIKGALVDCKNSKEKYKNHLIISDIKLTFKPSPIKIKKLVKKTIPSESKKLGS
jgi:hypothetical protein